MAIAFAEVAGSPCGENWAEDEFTAQRKLKCAWGDRHALLAEIVGTAQRYPYLPGAKVTARSGAAEPGGGRQSVNAQTGLVYYEHAIVTISYSSKGPDRDEETQDLFSETIEPNCEFLTCDYRDFRWEDGDDLKENEAPGRMIRGLDYCVTLYNVPAIPSSVTALTGHVNSAPFRARLLGITFPAETLLYNPPSMDRKVSTDETDGWTLSWRLSCRWTGWNKFWRQKTQQWDEIVVKKTGQVYKNYPLGDFSTVFGW